MARTPLACLPKLRRRHGDFFQQTHSLSTTVSNNFSVPPSNRFCPLWHCLNGFFRLIYFPVGSSGRLVLLTTHPAGQKGDRTSSFHLLKHEDGTPLNLHLITAGTVSLDSWESRSLVSGTLTHCRPKSMPGMINVHASW
jgi:hypothetical protein